MTSTNKQPPVVVERTYEGTAKELWELWTTKAGFEAWWGPEGFRVEVSKIEPRVGGALAYAMIADSPENIAAMKQMNMPLSHGTHGTYAEFDPHKRLRLLHVIDFVPGLKPYENNIVAEFTPQGASVSMKVTIEAHPTEEWTQRSVEGFSSQLLKLPHALEALRRQR